MSTIYSFSSDCRLQCVSADNRTDSCGFWTIPFVMVQKGRRREKRLTFFELRRSVRSRTDGVNFWGAEVPKKEGAPLALGRAFMFWCHGVMSKLHKRYSLAKSNRNPRLRRGGLAETFCLVVLTSGLRPWRGIATAPRHSPFFGLRCARLVVFMVFVRESVYLKALFRDFWWYLYVSHGIVISWYIYICHRFLI